MHIRVYATTELKVHKNDPATPPLVGIGKAGEVEGPAEGFGAFLDSRFRV